MNSTLLIIAATGVAIAGFGGFAVLDGANSAADSAAVAKNAESLSSPDHQPAAQPRRDDDDDDREGYDDDDRPYRNHYRQADTKTARTAAAGPRCTGYADADHDGICDHCARTPRGCTAGPEAAAGMDPYAGMPTVQDYERETTLANMQAAYNGESNARAKYLAFAVKADEEGYAGVAALFRAAAEAEGVHAANHAEVIRQLGATPEASVKPAEVKSTRENLEAAIAGESYEWDVMYPGMLSRARRDRDRAALRSFNFAMTAERDHAKFYRAALADLDNWSAPRTFFVCTVCGETVDKIDFKKCPSCFVSADEYITVN